MDASLPCRLTCPVLRAASRLTRGRAQPVLVAVRTHAPQVGLTFDDGPGPSTTPALLDVLAAHGATATFFLIGERAAAHPDLVGRIVAGGHEVGNHLWSDRPSVRLSPETFREELVRTGAELARHATSLRWFRPGSGMYTPRMLRDAERLGYRCALGSPWLVATTYRSQDAGRGRRLADRAHPGAIAVLHEGTPARAAVADVADDFLSQLASRGVRSVGLTHLVASPTTSGGP